MSERPSLLRSAAVVSFMTLLSRVTGLFQTIFLAHFLGAGAASDAFFVAFRLPNLLRRFTAEGTMTAAFLPTLSEVEKRDGEAAMRGVAARFLGTLTLLLSGFVVVAILAMALVAGILVVGRLTQGGWLAQLSALVEVFRGLRPAPPEMALVVRLGRIMFPYLALVSLTAGIAGVLNLRGRFGLPASVSIFWNLAFIAFGWAAIQGARLAGRGGDVLVATLCAVAVLVGGVVQLAVLWPTFRRDGFRLDLGLHLKDPDVARILKRMVPGLLAAGIYPINVLISTVLASHLREGAQTVLFNSGMMGEMVLGVFAMGLVTASLPTLARQADAQDWDGMRHSLAEALRGTLFLAIPACVGMAVLARPIMALILRTGRYGEAATDWTAATVVFQCMGVPFVAVSRIGTQALYALKDYRGPVKMAVLSLAANVGLTLWLMGPLDARGVALANGLSSAFGLVLLGILLHRRLGALPLARIGEGWAQSALASVPMALAALAGSYVLGLGRAHGRLAISLRLFPLIAVCGLVFGAVMLGFGNQEARKLFGTLRRRVGI